MAYVESTGFGHSASGRIMPDTNSACGIALRSNSEIVRNPVETLYGITRNAVRREAGIVSVKARNAQPVKNSSY